MSSSSSKEGKKQTAYTAFNAVDDAVSKPVLGSDGAANWQEFRSKRTKTLSSSTATSGGHYAPLKHADRAAGFTRRNELENEIKSRQESGAAPISSGYTHFKEKPDDSAVVMSAKERKRIECRLRKPDQEYFMASSTFTGWKWDYVFTTKRFGTGYYFDGWDSLKELNGELTRPPPPSAEQQQQQDSLVVDNEATADSSKNEKTESKKKKKRKRRDAGGVVIVSDPNNPLEQVAKAIEAKSRHTLDPTLPHGWESSFDKTSQKTYYYNRSTGERTWEKPLPEEGWKSAKDTNGKEYFYNTKTNETRWEKPTS